MPFLLRLRIFNIFVYSFQFILYSHRYWFIFFFLSTSVFCICLVLVWKVEIFKKYIAFLDHTTGHDFMQVFSILLLYLIIHGLFFNLNHFNVYHIICDITFFRVEACTFRFIHELQGQNLYLN